jgi:polyisoprenoid-binding protein YceI
VTNPMEAETATLTHFVVDAGASRFSVQAFATGFLSAMGHNPVIGIRTFSGEVNFSSESLQASGLKLAIQAGSLGVQDDISDKDRREIEKLMNEQILEPAKYPEIVFEAAQVAVTRLGDALYSLSANGNLSFHGASRSQPVTARVAVFGEMLRASGDFTLDQSDYGIKPISVAGGALKVKDELKFSFELVARKKE